MSNILIIDDDLIASKLIIDELCEINYKRKNDNFIVCSTIDEFKEKISQTIDIVLCDYNLGDATAQDVIEQIYNLNIDTPIIIVTGAIGEEKTAELMKKGATDLVLKNNMGKLDQIIDRELKNVQYKIDQYQIMEKVNLILYRLAKTVNWIMQHDLAEISFKKILHSFGLILNIDRSYIFEKNRNTNVYDLLYLWCDRKNCVYKKSCNTYTTKCVKFSDDFNDFLSSYIDNNKVFYGVVDDFDIEFQKELIKNNIKSIAIFPIFNPNKEIWGFIGFDDCSKKRIWSNLEINTLIMLGAILGTVVYKINIKNEEDKIIAEQINLLKTARESIITKLNDSEKKGEQRYGYVE